MEYGSWPYVKEKNMVIITVLGKIISIFIIMVIGIICYKMNIIDKYAKDKLSQLSTWIVCPMLVFMSFQMEYDVELLKKMLVVFGLALVSFIISIFLANILLREKEGYDNAVERFGAIFTNCGFIGIPLGSAIFGNIGVIYATMFVAAFHIFCWTYGITLLDQGKFQLKKLVNPCLVAVVLGILFFVFQIKVPENIAYALNSLSNMNTPLAMLISGVVLAQLDLKATIQKLIKGRLLFVVLLRGIISPAIFAILLRFVPIDEQMRIVSAMTAACPTGAFTITLSILYGRDDNYGTEILCTSTLLSILTIPICMMLVS